MDIHHQVPSNETMKKVGWGVFVFFAVAIGCYPLAYLIFDMTQGLLSSKPQEVLNNTIWKLQFYQHILLGGIALLTGWSQFNKTWRVKYVRAHRTVGKIYLIAVLFSGIAGLYIAFFATGGIISSLGFGSLAVAWLFTSINAYFSIRKKEIDYHEQWMIRSYALTFAAVMLRIWLPTFQIVLGMNFIDAYQIIAWFCWVPNVLVAEWIVRAKRRKLMAISNHLSRNI